MDQTAAAFFNVSVQTVQNVQTVQTAAVIFVCSRFLKGHFLFRSIALCCCRTVCGLRSFAFCLRSFAFCLRSFAFCLFG